MLINRIVYILLLVASFVFSSFYGGYIPELIRYSLMIMPFILLAYIFLVYIRINAGQGVKSGSIVKGEKTDYYFNMENHDIIPYMNIELKVIDEVADITFKESSGSLSLMPKEKKTYRGSLVCRYAGTYNVGVRYVLIPDFLGIFRIKYRLYRQVKVHVRPVEPGDINIKSFMYGGVQSRSMSESNHMGGSIGGNNIREYIPGDNPRSIHWKSSAKLNKLVTRFGDDDYEEGSFLIIDTSLTGYKHLDRIKMTDRMLHTIVTVAKGYICKEVRYSVIYSSENRLCITLVASEDDYRSFYERCEDINFSESGNLGSLFKEVADRNSNISCNYVVISADCARGNKLSSLDRLLKNGSKVTVINVAMSENERISDNGAYEVINIGPDDNICEVLSE